MGSSLLMHRLWPWFGGYQSSFSDPGFGGWDIGQVFDLALRVWSLVGSGGFGRGKRRPWVRDRFAHLWGSTRSVHGCTVCSVPWDRCIVLGYSMCASSALIYRIKTALKYTSLVSINLLERCYFYVLSNSMIKLSAAFLNVVIQLCHCLYWLERTSGSSVW